MTTIAKLTAAKEFLQAKLDPKFLSQEPTGLILGTGLNVVAKDWGEQSISFADIPHFPLSQSKDHGEVLRTGYLEGLPLIIQTGRVHLYEGYSPEEVCFGVRLLAELGVKRLIITNSAGALNPKFLVPSIMLVTDQINLTGVSPLTGPNNPDWGLRFPDLSGMFDAKLQKLAQETALELGLNLERGVYVGVHGPELETPAETRFYRMIGADAIGMSSVLEAIAAKHRGLEILELACLANKNLPDCMQTITIAEIVAKTQIAAQDLSKLLQGLAAKLTNI